MRAVSGKEGHICIKADAILLACGAREGSIVERGRIFGERPARVYQTFQLLQLIEKTSPLPGARNAIVGSEVISYSIAEKLEGAGEPPVLVDHERAASCSFLSRFYFFRKTGQKAIHLKLSKLVIKKSVINHFMAAIEIKLKH